MFMKEGPFPVALDGGAATDSTPEEDDLMNLSRVRQYFPETWLWFECTLGYVIEP